MMSGKQLAVAGLIVAVVAIVVAGAGLGIAYQTWKLA
jgi:hypothetical protein